jgi:hypothetical protein
MTNDTAYCFRHGKPLPHLRKEKLISFTFKGSIYPKNSFSTLILQVIHKESVILHLRRLTNVKKCKSVEVHRFRKILNND